MMLPSFVMHCAVLPPRSPGDRSSAYSPVSRAGRGSGRVACPASARSAAQKTSLLGHFGLLLKVLALKLLPQRLTRRRPKVRPTMLEFRRDVGTVGLGVVQVSEDALAGLRDIAAGMLSGGAGGGSRTSHSFRSTGGLSGAFPSTMSWHWAADPQSLELFRPAAHQVMASLGADFELVAASFVIADGGCRSEEAKFHLDFGPPSIPQHVAATALAPLYPREFPKKSGNLEYKPWDDKGSVAVHLYRAGEAAVFDGKLSHRTQPFAKEAFEPRSSSGETSPLGGLRVLVSLSFARIPEGAPWRQGVASVLKGYNAPLPQSLSGASGGAPA